MTHKILKEGHRNKIGGELMETIDEIDIKYAVAYFSRGWMYDKQKRYDLAIKDYTKAIEINPEHAGSYYFRGLVYALQYHFDMAIKDYTKAIAINPRGANAYFMRGISYALQDRLNIAISDLTKAVKLNPKHADAYDARGEVYSKQNKNHLAVSDFNRAIEIRSRRSNVLRDDTSENGYAQMGTKNCLYRPTSLDDVKSRAIKAGERFNCLFQTKEIKNVPRDDTKRMA